MDIFDVILVPGGGVREGGAVPPWTEARLDLAITLSQDQPIITLSAGTVHRPPVLDKDGFPVYESVAAARYLMTRGIPPDRILTENCSYDTIGNAYFSRVVHVDPGNFRKPLIITSEFHMPRTKEIFQWVYSLNRGPSWFHLSFRSVPDSGMSGRALRARMNKEKASLENFLITRKAIGGLKELHLWLHTRHAAYAVGRKAGIETGDILDTY